MLIPFKEWKKMIGNRIRWTLSATVHPMWMVKDERDDGLATIIYYNSIRMTPNIIYLDYNIATDRVQLDYNRTFTNIITHIGNNGVDDVVLLDQLN